MTPQELRADIPALRERTYLNYGAHGPSPEYVVDAAASFLEAHEYGSGTEGPYDIAFDTYERVRERIAAFVGARPEEIALTESTTDGINRIASAIEWSPGDVVVRTDLEHPAGILPWKHLERKGVEVRVVGTADGHIETEAFADAVSDAKLACFSAINWTHGTQFPVRELAEIAADAGAFSLVDAVQTPGQRDIDVSEWGADVVVAAGHKWLLGPWGAGFMYVSEDRIDELVPGAVGYRSVTSSTATEIEFKPGAPRFEIGTTSPAPHVGLVEAITAIEEVGIGTIEVRIKRLTDRLKDGLDDDQLVSPRAFHSGLITIAVDDPEATVDRFADRDVVIRSLPFPEAIRVSVHAVSSEAEIDSILELLTDE